MCVCVCVGGGTNASLCDTWLVMGLQAAKQPKRRSENLEAEGMTRAQHSNTKGHTQSPHLDVSKLNEVLRGDVHGGATPGGGWGDGDAGGRGA